jgi:hypothetical protein
MKWITEEVQNWLTTLEKEYIDLENATPAATATPTSATSAPAFTPTSTGGYAGESKGDEERGQSKVDFIPGSVNAAGTSGGAGDAGDSDDHDDQAVIDFEEGYKIGERYTIKNTKTRKVSSGGSAVYFATDSKTGEDVAIKAILNREEFVKVRTRVLLLRVRSGVHGRGVHGRGVHGRRRMEGTRAWWWWVVV